MKANDIIQALERSGVAVSLTPQNDLKIKAPTGALSPLHRQLLSENKPILVEFLASRVRNDKEIDLSLFFFAADEAWASTNKYYLYLESAKRADELGFSAVWTPERHFNKVAGLYPNPSVLSAALAMVTSTIELRAGSVVLPIQNPLRVAEEWSIVDNLSNGRAAISFATGWVPNDFVFAPENFENRRDVMYKGIEQIRELWRGNSIQLKDGLGKNANVATFPKPIRTELPVWLSCATNPETFRVAGERGYNVITALLAQSLEEAGEKILIYKDALARNGHDPDTKTITIMLHTFMDTNASYAIETARRPFCNYMKSHVELINTVLASHGAPDVDLNSEKDLDALANFAYERYLKNASLIGSPQSCLPMLKRIQGLGITEVACLIDFGIDADKVINSLAAVHTLKKLNAAASQFSDAVA